MFNEVSGAISFEKRNLVKTYFSKNNLLEMHLIQFFKENNLALFWLSFAEVLILL